MTLQDVDRAAPPVRAYSPADYTLLRIAMWSVAVYAGIGLLGFVVFAGFWPPPASKDLLCLS